MLDSKLELSFTLWRWIHLRNGLRGTLTKHTCILAKELFCIRREEATAEKAHHHARFERPEGFVDVTVEGGVRTHYIANMNCSKVLNLNARPLST